MYVADAWKEYELIDCSCGERLERWGKYILCRPDPQAIWQTERRNPSWTRINGHYHRSNKGGGEWDFSNLPKEWPLAYRLGASVLRFRLKPFAFKHTGLFPEQAANWEYIYNKIKAAPGHRHLRVLNLFAYTGGATLAAAAAGAAVTHVDASKGMVQWAKENARFSGLEDAPIRWLVDDCAKFVERELRRGSAYDAIILDPPSYGRGPKGEVWKLEDGIYGLLSRLAGLLKEDAAFFLLNSYTTGLQPAVMSYLLETTVAKRLGGRTEAGELLLPVQDSGLLFPCGCTARWEASFEGASKDAF